MKRVISKEKWDEFVQKIKELPDDAQYEVVEIEYYKNDEKSDDCFPLLSYHVLLPHRFYDKKKFEWLWLCKGVILDTDTFWKTIPMARILKEFSFTDDKIEILVEGEYLQWHKQLTPFKAKIVFKKIK